MFDDNSLLSVCGRFCGQCVWFLTDKENHCLGCNNHEGHPSWGDCKIFSCVKEHEIEYCGLCNEFPCNKLIHYYDPENPEGARNAAIRVAVNAYRAKHGDEQTLNYLKKVGNLNKPI